eukprot:CAMPEP_0115154410 /NCGR_PEP_ID=MMETSP0227-20121206/67279_1 /TAXON_ID=89957 /ORGANISM="Polarella glacialis, Strain CCMP 1383" /LENGTH=43 /DNA_ID= /DNA_START= /DNA_END= /DNA_ORIENTATION=
MAGDPSGGRTLGCREDLNTRDNSKTHDHISSRNNNNHLNDDDD